MTSTGPLRLSFFQRKTIRGREREHTEHALSPMSGPSVTPAHPALPRVVHPVGLSPVRVDVRIVAATNADLTHESEHGRFRRDPSLLFISEVSCNFLTPLQEKGGHTIGDFLSISIPHRELDS